LAMTSNMLYRLLVACFVLISVNANAGDIRLQNLKYQNTSLSEIVGGGKFTLVMIWATDCVPCEAQKPMIQEFHTAYINDTARVIGIANDGVENVAEIASLIEKHDPTYANYITSPDIFESEFEILTGKKFRATPTYIMFDRKGGVMGVAVGPITREKLDNIVGG